MKVIRNIIVNLFWTIPKEFVLIYWEVIVDVFKILSQDYKEER